ncbi:MAG TPA: riboflavin kinase [Patescibacteria group bacterium]|nr:riboflavin kinase [Patescibacteria group bacterium]
MNTIHGVVQKGHSRGKKLGFPTMNIPFTENIEEGIYVSQIVIDQKEYNSLTFIGAAQTFGETEIVAETYVFDFSEDVYGKSVIVTLVKKLRGNQKFDSEEALVSQMEEDKKNALAFFDKSINK